MHGAGPLQTKGSGRKTNQKKKVAHKNKNNNSLAITVKDKLIKQPLQISKVFLRLHQHMFYIFCLA